MPQKIKNKKEKKQVIIRRERQERKEKEKVVNHSLLWSHGKEARK